MTRGIRDELLREFIKQEERMIESILAVFEMQEVPPAVGTWIVQRTQALIQVRHALEAEAS